MKQKYPYTDDNGVLHASRHVQVFIDIPYVRSQLESAEDWYEEDGCLRRSYYLGSWLSQSPSGKVYTPWANSNVDACPVCAGLGSVRVKRKRRLQTKYRNKASKLRTYILKYHGYWGGGQWPQRLVRRLHGWDALARATDTCARCGGLGSAEAHDDELFSEALESFMEKEPDLYIDHDSGDIFVVQFKDKEEQMILHVDADYPEGDAAFEVRNDHLFPWLEAQGYAEQDAEWQIPTECVFSVEAKIVELNIDHGVMMTFHWTEEG